MRKALAALSVSVAGFAGLGAHPASAQLYFGVSGGVNQIQNYGATFVETEPVTATTFSDPETIRIKPGLSASASIGYRFLDTVRVEFEAGYIHANYRDLTRTVGLAVTPTGSSTPVFESQTAAVDLSGSKKAFTGVINVFYDVPTGIFASPYIGVGVGVAHEKATLLAVGGSSTFAPAAPFGASNYSNHVMFQGEIGVNFNVTNHFVIAPAFRYQQIDDSQSGYGNTSILVLRLGARVIF